MMRAMFELLVAVVGALRAGLRSRTGLIVENLALRQQLAVLRRRQPHPELRPFDRAFWVLLSRSWSCWAGALAIVKPATVIAWHRRGFAWYWTRKSRRLGRPPIGDAIIALIQRMARENPTWSRRRVANELAKLGHDVDKCTVAKYMSKPPGPTRRPSLTWATFVRMHLEGAVAIDFLTVPTAMFDVLYVFFVLSLERRRVFHVKVTSHPYAAWAAQQMVEAVGLDPSVVRLIRDGDGIYGAVFDVRVEHMGIRQLRIAPRSPWQNGYAERL